MRPEVGKKGAGDNTRPFSGDLGKI